MVTLDQITTCSHEHRTDLEEGQLKIGPDYACLYTPRLCEDILPNPRGCSIVASCAGEVYYTGEIRSVSVRDTHQPRTTFCCKPAEPSVR